MNEKAEKFTNYQRVRISQDRRIEGIVLPSSDHKNGIIHVRFVWIESNHARGSRVVSFFDGELAAA